MKQSALFGVNICAVIAVSIPINPAVALSSPAADAQTSRTVLLTKRDIDTLKQRQVEFGDFKSVISGCIANAAYMPKPTKSLALEAHYSATGVNTDSADDKRFANDAREAYRQGLCHQLTGHAGFATIAQRIIDGWAGTLTSVTTPQAKATLNFNSQYLILAASWVRGVNGWDNSGFDRFLTGTVLPNSSASRENNHGAWGVYLDASAAAYLGDAQRLSAARDRWNTLMKQAIQPDGTMPAEMERSATSNWRGGPDKGVKGISYTHYFMLPATLAAKIFADQGQPVWQGESGGLFEAAFAKSAGWTLRPDTFPYYASNNGKLEGVRNAGYFPLLLRYYRNKDAKAVVKQGQLGDGGFVLLSKLFEAS